ncbi:MAG: cobalamin biosynthesis protein [Desulfobacterales bacterium]|nr:cobalamin biosynthesis protein [Desulfobacterales bacterium]
MIVLLSISKIYRIPGLRIGFLVAGGPADGRSASRTGIWPWSVNSARPGARCASSADAGAAIDALRGRNPRAPGARAPGPAGLPGTRSPACTPYPSDASLHADPAPRGALRPQRPGRAWPPSASSSATAAISQGLSERFIRICPNARGQPTSEPPGGAEALQTRWQRPPRCRGRKACRNHTDGRPWIVSSWLVLPAAFALDMLLGDPRRLPHPVRWMGRAIGAGRALVSEADLRARSSAGGLFAAALVAGAWALTACAGRRGTPRSSRRWGPASRRCWSITCLSVRSLERCRHARSSTCCAGEPRGRKPASKVALIVGRDVERYQAGDIARATVETVAENFVDGVLSPLLFAAVGGAPLAMAFKMASTLDSMVGYKNERYLLFGKASARLDDVFNFIPARLSVPLIALAAQLLSRTGRRALRTAWLKGANHTSPNAGRPEAAFAGALGVQA